MISITSAADNTYIPCIGTSQLRDRLAAWYDAGRMPELVAYNERHHRVEDLPIPTPDSIEQPPPRLNTLYWPIFGVSRYAYAVFLLDADSLAALQADVASDGNAVTLSYTDAPDAEDDPRTYPMYYVADRQAAETGTDLYFVTFADIRYYWQNVTGMGDGTACTWDDVFTQLAAVLPDSPAFTITDAVLAVYLAPSTLWNYQTLAGRNTTWLLDAAAALVGSRILVTPDAFTLQRPTDANLLVATDAYDANVTDDRLGGGGPLSTDDWSSSVPANAQIIFSDSPPTAVNATTGGTAPGSITAWLDPQSATDAEQSDVAAQWAADYYAWQAAPYDVTWIGFVLPPDSAFLSAIEVSHDAGYSKVYRPPLGYSPLYRGWSDLLGYNPIIVQGVNIIAPAGLLPAGGVDGVPTPFTPYYPYLAWAGYQDDSSTAPSLCIEGSVSCVSDELSIYSTAFPVDHSPWVTAVNTATDPNDWIAATYYMQDQVQLDAGFTCDETITGNGQVIWGLGVSTYVNQVPGFGIGGGSWAYGCNVGGQTNNLCYAGWLFTDCGNGGGTANTVFPAPNNVIEGPWTHYWNSGTTGNGIHSLDHPFNVNYGTATGGFGVTVNNMVVDEDEEGLYVPGTKRYMYAGAWSTTPNNAFTYAESNIGIPPACFTTTITDVYYQSPAFFASPAGLTGLMGTAVIGGIVVDACPVSWAVDSTGLPTPGSITNANSQIGGFWVEVPQPGSPPPPPIWVKVLAVSTEAPCVPPLPPPPPPPPPPPLTMYDCVSGTCVVTEGGTYSTLAACLAACAPPPPSRYNCVDGACVSNSMGTYPSLAACTAACGISPPPPPCACPDSGTLTVNVVSDDCPSINGAYVVVWVEADLEYVYTNAGCTGTPANPCIESIFLGNCTSSDGGYTFNSTAVNIRCPDGRVTTLSGPMVFICGQSTGTYAVDSCCTGSEAARAEPLVHTPAPAIVSVGSVTPARISLECVYETAEYTKGGKTYHGCDHPDKPLGESICRCDRKCGPSCVGYSGVEPDRKEVVDKTSLIRSTDGRVFNAGLCEYNGRRLLAYRAGLANGRIWVAEDGREPVRLRISHPLASVTQDDPRLVVLGGVLYCTFSAVGNTRVCSVLMAQLSDDLQVVRVFEPDYPARTQHEKNWVAFESEGEPYFVYSIAPHKILSLDLANEYCQEVASTPGVPLKGFDLRGGAPPVLHDGEWYHFYHTHALHAGKHYYKTYCYTFENRLPFAVTRYTPEPIWTPSGSYENTNPARSVIFPCGAVRDGNGWMLTAGEGDTDIIKGYYSDSTIEGALERVIG